MINRNTNNIPLIPGLKMIMFCHIQLETSFKFKCRAEIRSLLETNREKPTEEKEGATSVIRGL